MLAQYPAEEGISADNVVLRIFTPRSFAFPQLHCDGICGAMFKKTNCMKNLDKLYRDPYTRYSTLPPKFPFTVNTFPFLFQTGTCIRFLPFLYFRNSVKASIHRMIKIGYHESEFHGIISFLTYLQAILIRLASPILYALKPISPCFNGRRRYACPRIFITSIVAAPLQPCIVQHIFCCG